MLALRNRALTCSSRALRARRTNTTLSDAKSHAPLLNKSPIHPEEGFGKGFYISIAAAVGCLALYKLEQSISGTGNNPLTRAIEYYGDFAKGPEERNTRHTAMVERAAADRSLFQDSKSAGTLDLRFPESLNSFSPYNNVVGWASNDLAALQAHYETARRDRK